MSRNKGKFLFSADYFIQQSCGSTLRFPCSVSVDVHCGTDISVSQKLLHILRRSSVREQVACECVSKLMEMEALQAVNLSACRPAHKPHRTRRFIRAVRSNANKRYFLVAFGSLLRSRQTVYLVVSTVFFLDFTIKVEDIQFSVAETVLVLFGLGCPQDLRQRVTEVHGADFLAFGRSPISVLCLAPLYRILRRTVRYCFSRLMSCQVSPQTSPMRSPV